jgi:hypothetical protein
VNNDVNALTLLQSDELVVGGSFTTAGGSPSSRVARWSETGAPWVAAQLQGSSAVVGDTIELHATPATEYSGVTFQWQHGGVDIPGESGLLDSPTDGGAAVLTIESVLPSDAGEYRVVFTNPCGSATSEIVEVSVSGSCPADYNGNGEGDVLDFLDFIDDFGTCSGQPLPCGSFGTVDFNGDTSVDVLDFLDFIDAFGQGC